MNFDVGVRVVGFTEELQHDQRVGWLWGKGVAAGELIGRSIGNNEIRADVISIVVLSFQKRPRLAMRSRLHWNGMGGRRMRSNRRAVAIEIEIGSVFPLGGPQTPH